MPRAPARRADPGRAAPQRAGAAARGLRAGDRAPLQPAEQAQLRPRHRLLSARLVHDEAQPEAARARGRAAGTRAPASAAASGGGAGRARADVAPAGGAGRDLGPAARVAAAERRLARRARRRAADARLPRGPRRAPHQGADAGYGARHQPGDGHDGRIRARQGRDRRQRQRRHRRPPRQGDRGRRLPDAHQPLDARAVRAADRGDRSDRARASARRCTTTAPTSTRSWASAGPGDMGFDIVHFNLHKSFTQPHGGGGPGAGPIAVSDRIEPFLPRPQVVRARRRTTYRPRSRPPQVDRPAARLPGQLRRVRALATRTSARSAPQGLQRGLRGRGAERQLPARAAARGGRARVSAGRRTSVCACTSSCSRARR